MMKNVFFFFILKALFGFKIFKFVSFVFVSCRKHGLIRKIGSLSKFTTSQLGYQTIKIHLFPNLQSKDIKTMKYFSKKNVSLKIMKKMGSGD